MILFKSLFIGAIFKSLWETEACPLIFVSVIKDVCLGIDTDSSKSVNEPNSSQQKDYCKYSVA